MACSKPIFELTPSSSARKILYKQPLYETIFFENCNFFNVNDVQIRIDDDDEDGEPISIFIVFNSDNTIKPKQLYVEYSIAVNFTKEQETEEDFADSYNWIIKNPNVCLLLKSIKVEHSCGLNQEHKQNLVDLFPMKMTMSQSLEKETSEMTWDKYNPGRLRGVMTINDPPLRWNFVKDLPERVMEYLTDKQILEHGKTKENLDVFLFPEEIIRQIKKKTQKLLTKANFRLKNKLQYPTFQSSFCFRGVLFRCPQCGKNRHWATCDGERLINQSKADQERCKSCQTG